MPEPVTDPADPRLADYVGLRDPDHRGRFEAAEGVFIVEGGLAIERLVESPHRERVRSVLVSPRRFESLAPVLAGIDAPVLMADRSVMAAVAGFDIHRGAVAAVTRPAPSDPAELAGRGARLVLVVEGINDHENLGALFRNAAAFGAAAVLLDPTCADPLYRRSIRVSVGHVLTVPWARFDAWPAGLAMLSAQGFTVVALTPAAGADPIELIDGDTGPLALLVGAEGSGLSAGALAAADRRVRISMAAGVDSLNVATAAAVALHRLARLR